MLAFTEFRRIRKTYFDFETRTECRLIWNKYIQMKKKMNSIPIDTACKTSNWVACDNQVMIASGCQELAKYIAPPAHNHTFSFGPCVSAPPATPKKGFYFGGKQEEGNNPMNYATATVQAATTETQDQRKYLSGRLEEIYWEKMRPLEAEFGLTDDAAPTTPKELKERIASGQFTILGLRKDDDDEDDFEDDYFYGGWARMLKWRDPAKKSDFEGYKAAQKELQAVRQKTLDIIKIKDPEAGLKAVEDLESWKPTGAAN